MNVKTLICTCKGFDPFRCADMSSPRFEVDLDPAESFETMPPQFLAEGGNQILQEVLDSAENDSDTYVMVCACQEETQKKLFKKTLTDADFDPKRYTPSDLSNSFNEGFLARVHERLNLISVPTQRN